MCFIRIEAKQNLKKELKQKSLQEENKWLQQKVAVQDSKINILEKELKRLQILLGLTHQHEDKGETK